MIITTSELEQLPEVQESSAVLRYLEEHGIGEPAIAAGWTRTLIAGGATSDIDVSYVGEVHYEDAQKILQDALKNIRPSNANIWDVKGIWNAETAYGVKHTVDNFLLFYLNSIDSVYLATDGKLHDPTGFGFEDAQAKILRINEYDLIDRTPTPSEEVNVCLENCRRLAKFNWTPTKRTIERISQGVGVWDRLEDTQKIYFTNKLKTKYSNEERFNAKKIYAKYGWGFIFDS